MFKRSFLLVGIILKITIFPVQLFAQLTPELVRGPVDYFWSESLSIAADADNVYCVWEELRYPDQYDEIYGKNQIITRTRSQSGDWSSVQVISEHGRLPQIISKDGYLYLVWSDKDKILYKRKSNKQSWDQVPEEIVATIPYSTAYKTRMVIAGNFVGVLWEVEETDCEGTITFSIYYSEKNISGKWPGKYETICSDMVLGTAGQVYTTLASVGEVVGVAWNDINNVYYKQKALDGNFPKEPEIVSKPLRVGIADILLFDDNENNYIYWNCLDDSRAVGKCKKMNQNWSESKEIEMPKIMYTQGINNGRKPYFAWDEKYPANTGDDDFRLCLMTPDEKGIWKKERRVVASGNLESSIITEISMAVQGEDLYLLYMNYNAFGDFTIKGIYYTKVDNVEPIKNMDCKIQGDELIIHYELKESTGIDVSVFLNNGQIVKKESFKSGKNGGAQGNNKIRLDIGKTVVKDLGENYCNIRIRMKDYEIERKIGLREY